MRWIHFASQHLGVITLFWCLCEITQSNNSNGAPQSLFALFAVWCCQPARPTVFRLSISTTQVTNQ